MIGNLWQQQALQCILLQKDLKFYPWKICTKPRLCNCYCKYNYIIPCLLTLKITCKLREHEREDKNKVPDLPPTDKTRTVLIFVLSNDLLVNTSWHGVMWQISPHQAIDVVQDIKQVILLWTEILQYKNEHRIVQKNAITAMILFQQSSSFMCT